LLYSPTHYSNSFSSSVFILFTSSNFSFIYERLFGSLFCGQRGHHFSFQVFNIFVINELKISYEIYSIIIYRSKIRNKKCSLNIGDRFRRLLEPSAYLMLFNQCVPIIFVRFKRFKNSHTIRFYNHLRYDDY